MRWHFKLLVVALVLLRVAEGRPQLEHVFNMDADLLAEESNARAAFERPSASVDHYATLGQPTGFKDLSPGYSPSQLSPSWELADSAQSPHDGYHYGRHQQAHDHDHHHHHHRQHHGGHRHGASRHGDLPHVDPHLHGLEGPRFGGPHSGGPRFGGHPSMGAAFAGPPPRGFGGAPPARGPPHRGSGPIFGGPPPRGPPPFGSPTFNGSPTPTSNAGWPDPALGNPQTWQVSPTQHTTVWYAGEPDVDPQPTPEASTPRPQRPPTTRAVPRPASPLTTTTRAPDRGPATPEPSDPAYDIDIRFGSK